MKILYFFSLLIFINCSQNHTVFDNYFAKTKKQIDKETLERIKNLPEESIRKIDSLTKNHFLDLLDGEIEINRIFEESGIELELQKLFILVRNVQVRLNSEKDQFNYLVEEVKCYNLEYQQWEDDIDQCEFLINETIEKNYIKYSIGDSIRIPIPYEENVNSYKNAFFFTCPPDYENSDYKELVLKGIILDKYSDTQDSLRKFFDVKIVSKDVEGVKVLMQEIEVGDVFKLSLYAYGREIE